MMALKTPRAESGMQSCQDTAVAQSPRVPAPPEPPASQTAGQVSGALRVRELLS